MSIWFENPILEILEIPEISRKATKKHFSSTAGLRTSLDSSPTTYDVPRSCHDAVSDVIDSDGDLVGRLGTSGTSSTTTSILQFVDSRFTVLGRRSARQ
ncbi:hypothetical protein OROMI_000376 [Orobanche minor]